MTPEKLKKLEEIVDKARSLQTSINRVLKDITFINDHFDEINIHFDTISHSLTIHKHYVFVSSWLMENWDDFSGIQVP